MNVTDNEQTSGTDIPSLLGIRIKLDEYEDAIIADLTEIRVAIRAGDISKADELVTELLNMMTEEIEDEEE